MDISTNHHPMKTTELVSNLKSLGLTSNEAKLFLTLLQTGSSSASTVAKKAGITRTTAYAALDSLRDKGLASIIETHGKQQYSAVQPEKLKDFALQEHEKAKSNLESIVNALPELESMTNDLITPPKVKFFEGLGGIKNIYKDSIDTLKEFPKQKRVKFAYSNAPEVSPELKKFLESYVKERKKHQIKVIAIIPEGENSLEYKKNSADHQADVRIMPGDISLEFDSEVCIYGNKVSIVSLNENRMHGVIIESPQISSTQRILFEIIWRACKMQT